MEPFHEIGAEPIREMVGSKPENLQSQTYIMPESLREVDTEPIREMADSKPQNLQELVLENAGSKPQNMQERFNHAGARPRNMQEGVLHDPNYAAWRDETTTDQRKGPNPRTWRSNGRAQSQELAVGRLEIAKKKARYEQEKKEKIQD